MRLFLFGLLGLNLLYFIWQLVGEDEVVVEKPAIVRGESNVPLLVRLNEVGNPPSATSPVPLAMHLPNQQPVAEPDPIISGRFCYTLGPFVDPEAMEKTKNQLKALGVTADVRQNKERKQRGYWVYLPSYPSREEALAVSRELVANGLKDYLIINDDKHKHAISLGLFSKKKGSERRIQEVNAMGFEPKLEVRYREETIFWLDYETVEEFDNLFGLIGTNKDQTLQQLNRECS
mgnify:CR=1 FL=1